MPVTSLNSYTTDGRGGRPTMHLFTSDWVTIITLLEEKNSWGRWNSKEFVVFCYTFKFLGSVL